MYTDTHAHLNDLRYKNVAGVIDRSRAQNVSLIINAGYDLESSKRGSSLAATFDEVYFAAGIHPSEAGSFDLKKLAELEKYFSLKKCVALGEIGLDYHYDGYSKQKQTALFMAQLETAKAYNLPVIIHSRDCTEDLIGIVKENPKLFEKCVMHCFSGSEETAQILVRKGIYISFAGPLTFKNARSLVLAAKAVPIDFILTETDCPYLSPEPFRGQTNEPARVTHIADTIADLKGVDIRFLNRAIRRNTLRLFDKISKDKAL